MKLIDFCRDFLQINRMWWQKYFPPVVSVCFQDAEQFFGRVLSKLNPGQGPPFQEYPARNGFYQHRMIDMTMHSLWLLHWNPDTAFRLRHQTNIVTATKTVSNDNFKKNDWHHTSKDGIRNSATKFMTKVFFLIYIYM